MTAAATSDNMPKRERVALTLTRITARVSASVCYRAHLGRGAFFAFLAPAFFIATHADAADRRVWHGPSPSSVVMGPPTVEGAVATVTFVNTTVHSRSEAFPLDWDGIEINVQSQWQADGTQAERITVTPPDGFIAIPESVTVLESETGEIQIIKFEGM